MRACRRRRRRRRAGAPSVTVVRVRGTSAGAAARPARHARARRRVPAAGRRAAWERSPLGIGPPARRSSAGAPSSALRPGPLALGGVVGGLGGAGAARGLGVVAGDDLARALAPRARDGRRRAAQARDDPPRAAARRARPRGLLGVVASSSAIGRVRLHGTIGS